MAQYYSGHYPNNKTGHFVKRYVIRNEQGNLAIVTTSGHYPDGFLCEAKSEWVVDELSYESTSKLVYVDPIKVRAKDDERIRLQYKLTKQKRIKNFKKHAKEVLIYASLLVVGGLAGYLLGK